MKIIGIDEVGRGPLAGPVTVCVVACEEKIYTQLKRDRRLPKVGKDSKKLSQKDREKYSKYLKHIGVPYVVTHVSNTMIDTKGISFCIKKAIAQGLKKLKVSPKQADVRLDGALKAPAEFTKQKTIIRGDEKEKIISWASILAKVSRDELMCKLGRKFPQYGFEIHKGYGTARHRAAIHEHGMTVFHRKTFCKKLF